MDNLKGLLPWFEKKKRWCHPLCHNESTRTNPNLWGRNILCVNQSVALVFENVFFHWKWALKNAHHLFGFRRVKVITHFCFVTRYSHVRYGLIAQGFALLTLAWAGAAVPLRLIPMFLRGTQWYMRGMRWEAQVDWPTLSPSPGNEISGGGENRGWFVKLPIA